jgi:hypothetical protein
MIYEIQTVEAQVFGQHINLCLLAAIAIASDKMSFDPLQDVI